MGRFLFINIFSFLSFFSMVQAQGELQEPSISAKCLETLEMTQYSTVGILEKILKSPDTPAESIQLYYVPSSSYSGVLYTQDAFLAKASSEDSQPKAAQTIGASDLEAMAQLILNDSLQKELNTDVDLVRSVYLRRELTGTGRIYGPDFYKVMLSPIVVPANYIGNIYGQFKGASWSRTGRAQIAGINGNSGFGQCFMDAGPSKNEDQIEISINCSPEYMIPWTYYSNLIDDLNTQKIDINENCSAEFAAKNIFIESIKQFKVSKHCLFNTQSQEMNCDLTPDADENATPSPAQ